jgi:hypothetical protein
MRKKALILSPLLHLVLLHLRLYKHLLKHLLKLLKLRKTVLKGVLIALGLGSKLLYYLKLACRTSKSLLSLILRNQGYTPYV